MRGDQVPFYYTLVSTRKPTALVVVGNVDMANRVLCEIVGWRRPVRVPITSVPEHNRLFINDNVEV